MMSKVIVFIEGMGSAIIGMAMLLGLTKVHDAIPLGIALIASGIGFLLVAARDAMDEG